MGDSRREAWGLAAGCPARARAGRKSPRFVRRCCGSCARSGRHVEPPTAAMHQYASDDLCYVIDEHVVALLLALAEQDDLLPGGGEPPETIRPVAVVRVGS